MSNHNNGLWHHPGFLLLWSGQTISQIGSQVTRGMLAEWFDLRTTMVIAAVGTALALIWIIYSPVRRIQSL